MSKPLEDRFWSKVRAGDENDCWWWTGAKNNDGYGSLHVLGSQMLAHRISYELVEGRIGESLVLHHCDNPGCVNPAHLYLGDHDDNMTDMSERGTKSYHGDASRADVLGLLDEPRPARHLDERLDVTRRCIYSRLKTLENDGLVERAGSGTYGATLWVATDATDDDVVTSASASTEQWLDAYLQNQDDDEPQLDLGVHQPE